MSTISFGIKDTIIFKYILMKYITAQSFIIKPFVKKDHSGYNALHFEGQ